ncbi:GNAT family N-acetyltransferase [Clostridiaceae bacterium M8S5]|nr:GNAT family N-acetyltransferase [Clostridiaceae bacterium M8S5]
MVHFNIVEKNDVEILRNISIKAFDDDLKKYGQLPPGINSIKWHTSKLHSGLYYKIMIDDIIVGGINLYDLKNGHFRLGAIFISPEYQNQGIGTKAIEFIEKKYNKIKKWTLDTPYLNIANHRFYERHGYKRIGKIKPSKNDDFYLYLYEKEISSQV